MDVGVSQGLASYNAYLTQHFATHPHLGSSVLCKDEEEAGAVVASNRGKLKGNFFAIEMLGDVGRRAGMGSELVRVDRAAEALRGFLEKWTEKAEREELGGGERSWKDVVHGTSALQVRFVSLDPFFDPFFDRFSLLLFALLYRWRGCSISSIRPRPTCTFRATSP